VSLAIAVSTIVSLTLTPMMCAQLLTDPRQAAARVPLPLGERCFDRLLVLYDVGLRCALRHRRVTLVINLATIALTGYLYAIVPKGSSRSRTRAFIVAVSEAAQDISYPAMLERQAALIDILLADPAIDGVLSSWAPERSTPPSTTAACS